MDDNTGCGGKYKYIMMLSSHNRSSLDGRESWSHDYIPVRYRQSLLIQYPNSSNDLHYTHAYILPCCTQTTKLLHAMRLKQITWIWWTQSSIRSWWTALPRVIMAGGGNFAVILAYSAGWDRICLHFNTIHRHRGHTGDMSNIAAAGLIPLTIWWSMLRMCKCEF